MQTPNVQASGQILVTAADDIEADALSESFKSQKKTSSFGDRPRGLLEKTASPRIVLGPVQPRGRANPDSTNTGLRMNYGEPRMRSWSPCALF